MTPTIALIVLCTRIVQQRYLFFVKLCFDNIISIIMKVSYMKNNNVKYFWVLYNNAVLQVICEGWHFTHMRKTLVWQHHSLSGKVLAHKSSSIPPLFFEVSVPSLESERVLTFLCWGYHFCHYPLCKNCSDSVIFFLFHFIFISYYDHIFSLNMNCAINNLNKCIYYSHLDQIGDGL